MSNTELVKFFDKVTRWRNPATILTQHTKAGKEQYVAFLGYDAERKPVRRSLGLDKDAAYAELAKVNQLIAEREFKDAPNVFDVSTSYRVKAALNDLEGHGASLEQAVAFFLEHHRPTKGHLTVEEGGALWVADLKRRGLSKAYIHQIEKVYVPHFNAVCGKKRLVDVTRDNAESFIYVTKASLSAYTKGEYISKMRSFFKAMEALEYYPQGLNPFLKVPKPQATREEKAITERDRCLSLADTAALLQYLADNEAWDMLAVITCVLFSGARMDEIKRLNWKSVLLERQIIDLSKKAAKKHRRRVLEIPDNALEWLKVAKAGMGGEWTLRSENAFTLKLKRVKKKLRLLKANGEYADCTFHFHTNFHRVSFASYYYATNGGEKTKEVMGHMGDVNVLHTNYKEVVTKQDAVRYWQIVPKAVTDAAKATSEKERSEREKAEAQAEACDGQAVLENGKWICLGPDEVLERAAAKTSWKR